MSLTWRMAVTFLLLLAHTLMALQSILFRLVKTRDFL